MYNCGVDIIEISRIEKSMQNSRFLEKLFSEKEREMFKTKNFSSQTVAANFAAKEAFSKSIKTGVRGFELKDISVLRDELGCPYFEFSDKVKEIAESKNLGFSVSLSHTNTYACAMVIAYKRKREL